MQFFLNVCMDDYKRMYLYEFRTREWAGTTIPRCVNMYV